MKVVLARISVVLVVVLFLFGLGCDNLVGPEGPAGTDGADGTDGTDGVPSPETYAAIEQTLEAYFAGWNAFVEYPGVGLDPAGIEVFGDVFAYPVFAVVTFSSEIQEHPDAESLGDELALQYGFYRSDESTSIAVEMLAFWDGSAQLGGSMAQQSSKQWYWVTAFVEVTESWVGDGSSSTRDTLEFALSFGADGVAQIKYFPIFAPPI